MTTKDDKDDFAILIVDDNSDNVFTLSRRLKKEGYNNIDVATNGSETFQLVAKKEYDLILLDFQMPDMNGDEVLTKLKSDPKTEDISILMISSNDTIENITACINLGAEDFLPKPFNVEILRARVGSCVKKSTYLKTEKLLKQQVNHEKQQYLQLLQSTFPEKIIEELKRDKKVEPLLYKNTCIVFADISGFTNYCSTHTPKEVYQSMQEYIHLCEEISSKYDLEKIKTIGDAFMAAGGMFEDKKNPTLRAVKFALELIAKTSTLKGKWDIRIGIDFGDVIAGVVGDSKYLFDIWGDKVNTAARLQTVAKPNSLYISKDAWLEVKDFCKANHLGDIELKGKGAVDVYEISKLLK